MMPYDLAYATSRLTTAVCSCPVCSTWPQAPELIDRFNPKMWAKWMREFLEEFLWERKTGELVDLPVRAPRRVEGRNRGGPLQKNEWKMKLWKQAHEHF